MKEKRQEATSITVERAWLPADYVWPLCLGRSAKWGGAGDVADKADPNAQTFHKSEDLRRELTQFLLSAGQN